jgi:uncharacterized protein YciI
MFLITLQYKKPIDIVEQYLVEHRAFLERGYAKDYFIVSGPKNPRTGGIILSSLKDREKLMEILKEDPFLVHDIADYEVTEFIPVKYHKQFAYFVNL